MNLPPLLIARVNARLALMKKHAQPEEDLSLEHILTSEDYFALTTATPLQRAICRVIDGVPLGDLAKNRDVITALGGEEALEGLGTTRPLEVFLLAAIRTAKSLTAAALAVRAALTCDLSHLGPGEIPRVSVCSIKLDLAAVVFNHIVGRVVASPKLSQLLVGEPKTDMLVIRHPSGRPVEIKVTAGSRAGSSLVARWSAGVIFDEAPRMVGSEDGVINFDDARSAVLGRLIPGAQLIALGSPWAPFGPIYDVVQKHHGRPDGTKVVIRGTGPAMNPSWWTPERCQQLRESDYQAYRTDVLGEFADPESACFPDDLITSVMRKAPLELEWKAGFPHYAAMDPATRSDAWTLVIGRRENGNLVVCGVWVWKPKDGVPLRPRAVLGEIATICARYHVARVRTDQWSSDALSDLALTLREPDGRPREGFFVQNLTIADDPIQAGDKVDLFDSLRQVMSQGLCELPPSPMLRADLLAVQRKVTQAGIAIHLPRIEGRHCDSASALAMLNREASVTSGEQRMVVRGHQKRLAAGGIGAGGGF